MFETGWYFQHLRYLKLKLKKPHGININTKCISLNYKSQMLGYILFLTIAEPTATPPAVAAICLNKLGCSWATMGCAGAGAGAAARGGA